MSTSPAHPALSTCPTASGTESGTVIVPRRPRALRRTVGIAALGAAVVVAALLTPGAAQGDVPPPAPAWTVEWSDDFDGAAGSLPGTEDWQIDLGHNYPGGPADWGTGEIQNYTDSPDNLSVDGDGNLRITPLRDGSGNWTSARIETRRSDFKAPDGGVLAIEGLSRCRT